MKKSINDIVLTDAYAETSISDAIAGFMDTKGPARVLFDVASQRAFVKTYTVSELAGRGINPRYEPFIILCERGIPKAAA
jgi:hypothetical protein